MVPSTVQDPQAAYVLIVEDEALVRWVIADAFREAGFSVVEASNGDEALAYLEAGGFVDLVFSDIVMPGTISGEELAERIARDFPDVKVFLTSGNLKPKPRSGVEGFFPKPYDIDRVIAPIAASLGVKPR